MRCPLLIGAGQLSPALAQMAGRRDLEAPRLKVQGKASLAMTGASLSL
jgi:hypothetical protein